MHHQRSQTSDPFHALELVRSRLKHSIVNDPDGVAGRDVLWIEHERLLNERDRRYAQLAERDPDIAEALDMLEAAVLSEDDAHCCRLWLAQRSAYYARFDEARRELQHDPDRSEDGGYVVTVDDLCPGDRLRVVPTLDDRPLDHLPSWWPITRIIDRGSARELVVEPFHACQWLEQPLKDRAHVVTRAPRPGEPADGWEDPDAPPMAGRDYFVPRDPEPGEVALAA